MWALTSLIIEKAGGEAWDVVAGDLEGGGREGKGVGRKVGGAPLS